MDAVQVIARLTVTSQPGDAIDDTMSREQAAEWLERQVRAGGGAFFP